ncbi:MAG: hypothetical protein ACLQVD_22730 [Capsulimonadaceae bacterium]
MKTRTIVTLAVLGTIVLVYLVIYGLACQTGQLTLAGSGIGDRSRGSLNDVNVDVFALQPSEFRFWYTQAVTPIPADGGVSYVTTRNRLSLGLIAVETATTVQKTGASSVTASVAQ